LNLRLFRRQTLNETELRTHPFYSFDSTEVAKPIHIPIPPESWSNLEQLGATDDFSRPSASKPSARASCVFTERISSSQNAIASKAAGEMEMSGSSQMRISSSRPEFKLTSTPFTRQMQRKLGGN
jgi:hypothetical protein